MPRGARAGSSSWPPWLLLLGVAAVLRAEGGATTDAPASPKFDCLDVDVKWSPEKTSWCREHHSVTLVTAAPQSKGHNCTDGKRQEWSEEKRGWCCSWHPTAACDSEKAEPHAKPQAEHSSGGAEDKFDCLDTQSEGDGAIWPEEKVDWCLKHKGVRILTRAPETTATPKQHPTASTTETPHDETHKKASHHHEAPASTAKPEEEQSTKESPTHHSHTVSTTAKPEEEQSTTEAPTTARPKEQHSSTKESPTHHSHTASTTAKPEEEQSTTEPPTTAKPEERQHKPSADEAQDEAEGAPHPAKDEERTGHDGQGVAHGKTEEKAHDESGKDGQDTAHSTSRVPPAHETQPVSTSSAPELSKKDANSDAPAPHEGSTLTCESDVAYYPLDMAGHGLTVEADLSSCQSRCAATEDCVRFSFWSLSNHCHLQDASAVKVNQLGFISGSPQCTVAPKTTQPPEPVENPNACLSVDAAYYPLDAFGKFAVTAQTAVECQAKCAADDSCARFSFYTPTKSCHLQGSEVGTSTSWSSFYLAGPAQCRGKATATIRAEKLDKAALVANQVLLGEVLGVLREAIAKDVGRDFPSQAVQVQLAEGQASHAEFHVTALPTSGISKSDLASALNSVAQHGAELNQALAQVTSAVKAPEQKFSAAQLQHGVAGSQGPGMGLPGLCIIAGMGMMVGGVASLARSGLRGRVLGEGAGSVRMLPGEGDIDGATGTMPRYTVLPEDVAPQV